MDGPAPPFSAFRDPEVAENDLAVSLLPLALVYSTLYVDACWWSPAARVPQQAQGRTVLLSASPEALAAVRAAEVPRLAELAAPGASARLPELARELETRPANVHLRGRVYRELAAGGRLPQLAELAAPFAQGPEAGAEDRRAWYAARLALGDKDLINELRAAIAHPDEPALYLVLGQAYLAAGGPDTADLAKACFEKVGELQPYGDDGSAAEEALEELAGEEE